LLENVGNLSIGVGNHCQSVFRSQTEKYLACVRPDITPIRGNTRAGNEFVTDRFIGYRQPVEQLRVVDLPETVVHRGIVFLQSVELVLGLPLDFVKKFIRREDSPLMQRTQHRLAVGEQESVANVEKKRLDRHESV